MICTIVQPNKKMIEKKLLRNSLDFLRWKDIFDLLSMDVIDLEIVKAMGVEIDASELDEVRKAARTFFEYYWSDRSLDNITDEAYVEKMDTFLQEIFSQIAENIGLEKSRLIYKWGIDYFPYDGPEGALEFRWAMLLNRYGRFGIDHSIPPPENIPNEKVEAVLQVVSENINKDRQDRDVLKALKKKPRTAWDKRVYETYEPEHSPLTGVGLQVSFHNFQLMWKQIEEILTKEELEAFNQWGIIVESWPWPDRFILKLPTVRIINF